MSELLADILEEAIYSEIQANQIYSQLAKSIKNEEGIRTFEILAKDEDKHRVLLEGWYKEKSGQPFLMDPEKVKQVPIEVDKQAGAIDALTLAMKYEEAAAKRYEDLAKKVDDDPKAQNLCMDLAAQEWGHYETLSAEKNAIIDTFYWFDMDYSLMLED